MFLRKTCIPICVDILKKFNESCFNFTEKNNKIKVIGKIFKQSLPFIIEQTNELSVE